MSLSLSLFSLDPLASLDVAVALTRNPDVTTISAALDDKASRMLSTVGGQAVGTAIGIDS